jgi:hypothetical protein
MNNEQRVDRLFNIAKSFKIKIEKFVNNRKFENMTESENLHYIHMTKKCIQLFQTAIALEKNRIFNIKIIK